MVETLWIVLFLVVLAVAAVLAYIYLNQIIQTQKTPNQGVVKHDWLPTGRIDFATRFDDVNVQNKDRPREFRLLVEERRIVESIAGNENLEIQWRLATLGEAKAVITQYHKYLSENSLIKSIPDLTASPPPSMTSEESPSAQPNLSIVASANKGAKTVSDSA
jgi:hypothetical protein